MGLRGLGCFGLVLGFGGLGLRVYEVSGSILCSRLDASE